MTAIVRATLFVFLAIAALPRPVFAAGTLLPATSGSSPLRIIDHHLEVLIENGYARTEVTQSFENPNLTAIEAIYSLPLPAAAALSEMSIVAGDSTLLGEVVTRDRAQTIYETERAAGGQAGLATKQGYQRFEFRVSSIPPGARTTVTFSYYQPIELDAGVGRYLYPLEEGGTDPGADAFWKRNATLDGSFSANIDLRSAWPIEDVRVPSFEQAVNVQTHAPGGVSLAIDAHANLDHDLIVYYRLPADLPGRVELVPFRADSVAPGTFMLVLTPGVDLAPLADGADYVFVLDVSGSMDTKLDKLKAAVITALRALGPGDRVRVVKFSDTAHELTRGFLRVTDTNTGSVGSERPPEAQLNASGDGVAADVSGLIGAVQALRTEGGTNLFAGMQLALENLATERAASVLLVTDGVANQGVIDGPSFVELLAETDVRVFGFLMGNSANWPLMQLITETSGGFYAAVSNADDIAGQFGLARSKMTHEAMHDFALQLDDSNVFDVSEVPHTVHHGEQVVMFGRYRKPGPVTLTIDTRITGKPQRYIGHFELPATDRTTPELERLWAYARVHAFEYAGRTGLKPADEVAKAIAALGVQYQLVTDETSMILLDPASFERFGIDPQNRERSDREAEARMLRGAGTPVNHSVAVDDAFAGAAASGATTSPTNATGRSSDPFGSSSNSGYGGGAATELDLGMLALLVLVGWRRKRANLERA
jgi:Ca-activated chloride channel family protein